MIHNRSHHHHMDNIDEFDSRMAELLDATYSVYRHEGALDASTLAEAIWWRPSKPAQTTLAAVAVRIT